MLAVAPFRRYVRRVSTVQVKNVPEDVHRILRQRAAGEGRSLQEYLLSELQELAQRPDPDVLIAGARERVHRTGSRLSAEQILAFRDGDRT